jgi:hypothetical protein
MLLTRIRSLASSFAVCFRAFSALAAVTALLGSAAPRVLAQTAGAADIAPANLPGRTITLNAAFAPAPFSGTGIFSITFAGTTYTIPIAQGNPTFYSGSYTAVTQSGNTLIRLAGYLVNGSPVQLVLVPSAASLIPGAFEMFADGVSVAKTGSFTVNSGSGGGGSGNPAVTSQTQLAATVGQPFVYQITTSPAATSFTNTGGNAPVSISPGSGLVTGTFTSAGTFTFSFTATNSFGTSAITSVTVTATAGSTGGGTGTTGPLATFAGTYTGNLLQRISGVTATVGGANYRATVTSAGSVVVTVNNGTSSGTLVGTVATNGAIAFSSGSALSIYRIATASILIASSRPVMGSPFFVASTSSTGATTEYSLQSSSAFVADTGSTPTPVVAEAPTNFVGYRNRVGSVFELRVTGAARGAVWGTDVYTDDSSVATAAVHAGVLAVGETKTVTVTILPGQSSYPASARNGVSSASWGGWYGSFAFAGAGAVTTGTAVAATARPALAPGFAAANSTLAAGGRLVCPINVTGGGLYTYQWYLNNVRIPGATANPYIVESLSFANAGTYTVDVTNALGTARLTAGTVTVGNAGSPVLTLQPIAKNVVPGGTFTVAASATGSGLAYQWFRNGTSLAGETGAILLRNNAGAADSGSYAVRVANSSGSVTSNAATITLSADASRPANISVRTAVSTGATVIPGFFIQGTGTKRVLIRAVGPGLGAFGLSGTMGDPTFAVFQGSTRIAANDDWSATNIGTAFSATGAFALPAGSKDAALVTDLAAGRDYTVQVTNASGTGGIVLIEVYDADALVGRSTSKLVNVSVRGQTAPGDDVLTLGLVIGGNGPRTLLVRGIGPTLAAFGVTGTVPDPAVQIFDGQARAILANDDWSQADFVSELALATGYVGAFALGAGSKDAATLALVQPGAYTIQVAGTAAAPTGEALVEVYEVP